MIASERGVVTRFCVAHTIYYGMCCIARLLPLYRMYLERGHFRTNKLGIEPTLGRHAVILRRLHTETTKFYSERSCTCNTSVCAAALYSEAVLRFSAPVPPVT